MNSSDFRKYGHELIDWLADYFERAPELPVTPDIEPGVVAAQLPTSPPESPEAWSAVMTDFERVILPGMVHWGHPRFFAYFPANTSPPSVLGELLTAGLGAQCMSWATSPAATELEGVVVDWLRQLLGLPETFTGVIQDTASTATLVALITARERATEWRFQTQGASAPAAERLRIYTSREAHSSVGKAAALAGFGRHQVRYIETDETYALSARALGDQLRADRDAGLLPTAVVATVGTTSSTAIDPLGPIGELCAEAGAWLHVDAALAGTAAILPDKRWILQGVERADSFVFNPHKWMLTNFDCSAYYVRDVPALLRTFSTSPEYLRTAHDPHVRNYRDWGIQLGRRFRALKLWFVLRTYGADGVRRHIATHLKLAQTFRGWLDAEPDWELLAPVPLNLVCFRHRPADRRLDGDALDDWNLDLLARVNAGGFCFLTHTKLGGRVALRLAIGSPTTREEHVSETWRRLRDLVAETPAP